MQCPTASGVAESLRILADGIESGAVRSGLIVLNASLPSDENEKLCEFLAWVVYDDKKQAKGVGGIHESGYIQYTNLWKPHDGFGAILCPVESYPYPKNSQEYILCE